VGGDGGYIASAQARRAPPDGYTTLFTPSSLVTNRAFKGNAPYDPVKDFAPVTAPVASAFAVVVHPSQPHLAFERFRRSLGLDIAHVSFGGGRSAITSVVAGHIPICIISLPNCIPHIQEESLRALMVSSTTRSQKPPDVPTAEEAGYPMLTGDQWQGILAPAGTPPEVIAVLPSQHRGNHDACGRERTPPRTRFLRASKHARGVAVRIKSELQSWRALVQEEHLRPG
jgi:tripartite-type tricarboxylate transporter receptor subunit TctC